MKKRLVAFFKNNAGRSIKINEIARQLDVVEDYEYEALKAALFSLVEENYLARIGKRYRLNTQSENGLTGKLQMVDGNYGFVVLKNSDMKDVFISSKNLGTAFAGDTVEIRLFAKRKGKNAEGEIIRVVKRNREEIVGTLEKTRAFYFVKPDEDDIHRDIYIDRDLLKGAKNGDKVVVHKIEWSDPQLNPEGEIKSVLGKAGAYDTEIASLAHEFNIPYVFPKGVLREAESITQGINKEELSKRLDLRDKVIFTIDPVDAKDFDDAVSVEKLDNGNYSVGIHIADVSHYVEENSHLDDEALKRGNSVYFVGKVIPMLPEKLSNGICSLVPYQDRLTYSVIAELTAEGKVVNHIIKKTVINSKRRFTYEEAQQIIESQTGDYAEELLQLNTLARVLRKNRMKSGSINFISPEVTFLLDKTGVPVDIKKKEIQESNQLIEEYMLLANQIVARQIGGSRKKIKPPFIYRVHDQPDQEKIYEFSNFVKTLGYSFDPKASNKTKEFQKLLGKVKGTEEEALINEVAIRSMAKAIYSANNIGHYGLGFKHYSHFTSPIRRYSDLIAHRLLYYYLEMERFNITREEDLEEICDHISATERSAISAERMSVKLKQMEFLQNHVGEDFHAIISGITNFGMFVELTQTMAEGMISLRDMEDDYYVYDEKNYSLIGRRTHKRFRLGDKITVRLIRIDQERRRLDFIMIDNSD